VKVFALAALVSALALGGCGSEEADETAAQQPTTITVTETTTALAETEPAVECSTSGLRLTLPEQQLPAEVAEVRERIFGAAVACDYETLEQIALEQGEGFTFSYGGGDSAAAYWRQLEASSSVAPKPLRTLATILTMPYTRNESGSYAWPTAYSENATEAAWQELVDAGLYTQEQVDSMQAGGTGYLGYRAAITADGDWQFFVAGD
jgi:hypothetical protein